MTAIDFPCDDITREETPMKEFRISLRTEQKNICSKMFAILVRNNNVINIKRDIICLKQNKTNGVEIIVDKDIYINLPEIDLDVEKIIIGSFTDNEEQMKLNIGVFKGFVELFSEEREVFRLDLRYLGGDSVCKYFEFIRKNDEWSCIVNTKGYLFGNINTLLEEEGYIVK